jgi:hypothetical protein
LTEALRQRGIEQLRQSGEEELWLILDGSDLRKPHARAMEELMWVRDLKGKPVRGYRTLNVMGLTPKRRGILYHRLFSDTEEGFESESAETQRALRCVGEAVAEIGSFQRVIWIMDRGFDDIAVWRTIWEQGGQLVCRVKHTERLVRYEGEAGEWHSGHMEAARSQLRWYANARTDMVVRRGRQKRPKLQSVPVEIRACPLRVTYATNVRREGDGARVDKALWLVEARLSGTDLEPWLLITDLPVTDADSALRLFRMYRQRWAVEDSFKFVKEHVGWEEVQLLDLKAIRTLVAMAWVAAGFLYELGIGLEWPAVRLLARLGGWAPRKNNPPGKAVITRGLRRLINMLTTKAFLATLTAQNDPLPPGIVNLLHGLAPGEL